MEDKKKIVITQAQIMICKALAAGDVERDQAKAEAEGIPFDYEAVKAQREQEMIISYARELQRMQEREEKCDKAFQNVIRYLSPSPKMSSIIYEYIPDMKTFREISDEDFAKLHGVGKKTIEDFKKMRALADNPKVRVKLNKAITAARRFYNYRDEHSDVIRTYTHLQRNVKTTDRELSWVLERYNG